MKSIDLYGAKATYRDDNILHIHYKGEFLNLDETTKIINAIRKECPWKISPVFISADDFSEHDNEAQEYLAGEEVMSYCSAVAVLSSNVAQRIAINFFIKFKKPLKPTRFFTSEEDAFDWLNQFESIKWKDKKTS